MKPNQVSLVAAAVPRHLQQVIHALEPRFASQIVGNVGHCDRFDRVHDDVPVVHLVTAAHLHMRTRPDANAASDSPASDSLAKALGEYHVGLAYTIVPLATLCLKPVLTPIAPRVRTRVVRIFGARAAVKPQIAWGQQVLTDERSQAYAMLTALDVLRRVAHVG
jgi:hypothetical protein